MTIHSLTQFGFRSDDPDTICKVLNALGLYAGTGSPADQLGRLQAAGHGFSVRAVDDALDKTSLNSSDRMTFKLALSHKGLLTGVRVP
jgi:hypothetical protein